MHTKTKTNTEAWKQERKHGFSVEERRTTELTHGRSSSNMRLKVLIWTCCTGTYELNLSCQLIFSVVLSRLL